MTIKEWIIKYGLSASGKTSMLKYLNGESINKTQAITAKCYCCIGYLIDGRMDCKMEDCPLYPFMPYRENPVPKKQNKRKGNAEALKKGRENKKRLENEHK